MKILMIMSFLLLGSCSVSMDEPVNVSRYSFPTKWQGYYTKVSGDRNLPAEFKVSDQYMSYKDESHSAEEDEFYVYQINRVWNFSDTYVDFGFYVEDSYEEQSSYERFYGFKDSLDNKITVSRSKYLNFTGDLYSAVYTKRPL